MSYRSSAAAAASAPTSAPAATDYHFKTFSGDVRIRVAALG